MEEEANVFGAEPEDAPPDNLIPFPRMRPSVRVRDAWSAAVARLNETHKRRHVMPSPLDVVPSLIRKRSMPGMPWPAQWPGLARRCKVYVGECVSVTAAIGAGKTSFAMQVGIGVTGIGHPVVWVPLELDPEQCDLRAVANMHNVHMSAVRENWSEERITHALTSIADLWHYVDEYDDPEQQFEAIEDAIMLAWEVYRLPPLVVVDHLGELVAEERDDRAALRRWARRFRRLALRTNSWIMLLNQVSKGNQAALTGKIDHDSASDMMAIEMGSQAIASSVSNGIALNVFKQDDTRILDVHAMVSKARNTGFEGVEGMRFDKAGGVWSALDYLPATPSQARAAVESDKKDIKHRTAPPRTPAQARDDLNAAKAGDAAAARRVRMLEAVTRHGMLGIEVHELKKVHGVGRGPMFHMSLQELERAGSLERLGSKVRVIARIE